MQKKVLIAESNETNREILSEVFAEDFEVIECDNSNDVTEILNKEGANLQAVLLDAALSPRAGLDLMEDIKKYPWYSNTPVFILTDESSLKMEKNVFRSGATDVFRKPFDTALIQMKIKNYFELFASKLDLENLKKKNIMSAVNGSMGGVSSGEFEEYHSQMLEFVGVMVECHNPENKNHIQRMKGLARIICEEYASLYPDAGLTDTKIDYIVKACLIHNIGMMAIPEAIILKPGRLTDEEYEYMKSHPLRGIEMLNLAKGTWDEEFDVIAREVVKSHHEKYDGGGYPEGLKGDKIPLSAQIISITDTYDALVNDRVYKKAFPKDVAFNMITSGDCGVFPPKILECFKKSRQKLEDYENNYVADNGIGGVNG